MLYFATGPPSLLDRRWVSVPCLLTCSRDVFTRNFKSELGDFSLRMTAGYFHPRLTPETFNRPFNAKSKTH